MEIVIRAAVMFCFLWLVTRTVGKRQLSELSAFELVLLVSMGDLIQQAITQEDYSVSGGVLTISTFALLSVLLSLTSWRFPRTRRVLEGRPAVVIRNGELQERVMADERLTRTELLEAARKNGVRDLGEVELGVLENDGSLSFFTRAEPATS
jgi:uncharacterized membrane protein YcaP (DUF421 family)